MTHGSLFSGIGGFDLAAQWMGWTNEFHCEINPFGRKVLHHYWPNATQYHDIKTTDFSIHRGLGILTGGFPCQPYSTSGKRLGKEDDRHLWPEMLRAVRQSKPRWVVGENVRGLTNWNGGMVFDEVQSDLETEGYQILPFLLPAASVQAPHERYRIWFIAHSDGYDYQGKAIAGRDYSTAGKMQTIQEKRQRLWDGPDRNDAQGTFADTFSRLQPFGLHDDGMGGAREQDAGIGWQQFPTQHPVCSGNDGLSSRLDGTAFPRWRKETMKGYGNAIVPQVVYQIFQAIEQYESLTARPGTK